MNDDSRRRLYERFKATIGLPAPDYFDEDDLVEIYDYADDYADDFVKLEVLFYGARMFPDSRDLRIRRDYLYYYLGNDDAVRTMLDRHGDDSVLSRLLAMRSRSDSHRSTTDELDVILGSLNGKLDDEEVIRFIDEASTDENYPWLVGNIERVKEASEYPVTAIYEIASAAREHADMATAIRMADMLTMLEPFNTSFWELLADTQLMAGNIADVLSAVDYALALDPASKPARLIKGVALLQQDKLSAEGIELLSGLAGEDALDVDGVKALAMAIAGSGRIGEALAILDAFLRTHPGEIAVLDMIMYLNPGDCDRLLRGTDTSGMPESESFWTEWGMRHALSDNHAGAAAVLETAYRAGRLAAHLPLLFEELYRAKRYMRVLELYADPSSKMARHEPEVILAVIMSLVRLGKRTEALEMANKGMLIGLARFVGDDEGRMCRTRLVDAGMRATLRNLTTALEVGDDGPVDDFDPFLL